MSQCAMGHELCLYRSSAVRQGTVVLLLKISNSVDEETYSLLSHSESFATLLLEVAEMRPQSRSKLSACCKLVATSTILPAIATLSALCFDDSAGAIGPYFFFCGL